MSLMTHSADTTFLNIENAAHGGAFGKNPIPEPTEAQCKAGNYKMGRISFQGLSIAIEQPRGTYRSGIDPKSGKQWTSRMAAHYGYISATKGADGDGVDCFVGFYPQSDTVYAINQYIDGRFDEHKICLAFPDEESARNAYVHSYERGWKGLKSIAPLSISQLKWWLKHGNKSQPIKSENLPSEGLEAMTIKVQWNSDALPYDHTLDSVLYEIRRSTDSGNNLLLDAVTVNEILDDSDGVLAFDALVTPYAKLERKMEVLQGIMERAGQSIRPISMQITDPFKQNGVANVAVVYELSDGQTVSIYLHNPDVTPQKMAPTDEIISWKWLLNKKDITIVVAPERGQDLNVREVARRIMKLAEKNSPAFARANVKRSERMQAIQSLKDEIVVLEKELETAQHELEVAKVAAENRPKANPVPAEEAQQDNQDQPVINPAIPEDYAKIMQDEALQIKYQDVLDAFFQERIIAIRNALRNLGWDAPQYDPVLSKQISDTYFQFTFDYKQVGAGANVVGMTAVVKSVTGVAENAKVNPENRITDDLAKTAEQLAAEIDAAAIANIPNSTELNPVSSEIEIQSDPETEVESEDMKAASEFLKSVIDGDKDKDDLMVLLDKIEASANAIIEAGKGEDYDVLIGQAAERWAELDKQANG